MLISFQTKNYEIASALLLWWDQRLVVVALLSFLDGDVVAPEEEVFC